MPSISDPGARLVRACVAAGVPYTVIPGPSAVLTAVVGSGLSAERFYYAGFLPPKSGGRERDLRLALDRGGNERIFRVAASAGAHAGGVGAAGAGSGRFCVARELTKQFEEFRRGPAAEVFAHYQAHPPKGEITLVIGGKDEG